MQAIESLVRGQGRYTVISRAFDVKIDGFEAFQGDALAALFSAVQGLASPITWKVEPFKTFEGALTESKPHDDFIVGWNLESIESTHVAEFKPWKYSLMHLKVYPMLISIPCVRSIHGSHVN